MKICYVEKTFHTASRQIIEKANAIITEYADQGFDLTLRQLYYQFVSRDLIKNNDKEYKRLGSIINDARLAGLIDWDAIEDRTRNLRELGHWSSPSNVIYAAYSGYALDKWEEQPNRPEVWIEKDALIGVIEGICNELDVPYFSCRGYVSQSEMWAAAQRASRWFSKDQTPIILHLGDHDPSGKDMTRDIQDRLNMFLYEDGYEIEVQRLALNWDQVQQYSPPPNPAKLSDARADNYIREFGDESWELDALNPTVIRDLIENAVLAVRDEDAWERVVEQETKEKDLLRQATLRWPEVASFLEQGAA